MLRRAGLVYLYSRLCVLVGAGIVAGELRADLNITTADFPRSPFSDPHYADKPIPRSGLRLILDALTSWDGVWYQRIVTAGYPRVVRPHVTYFVPDARAAFFPAYPLIVRAFDAVAPGGPTFAALVVNLILGAAAVYLVGVLARELFDQRVAARAMALMALFPGAFVLSFAYTEALMLTVAAACLLALHRRQWLVAGLCAAIGTASRPNGVALIVACAVAALVAVRTRREWSALISVLLAPLGLIAFHLFLWHHTGERTVWFRVQSEAWGEGASWGWTALHRTLRAFTQPLTSPTNTITAATVLAMLLLLWCLWRYRLPAPIVAYCVVVLAMMLIPATVTARPRFLYTAFPLLISAAAWLDERIRHRPGTELWAYIVGACSAGLVGLVGLYGSMAAIP